MIELSGEHPTLAVSEILAITNTEGTHCEVLEEDDGLLVLDTDTPSEKIANRAALAWHISEYQFSSPIDEVVNHIKNVDLEGKSFAIRAKRVGNRWSGEEVKELTENIGTILKDQAPVDLEDPELEIRVAMSRSCHVGKKLFDIDRTAFEERKPRNRPFSTPISLHPRLARALVNLTGVKAGEVLLDPFCGTGGILIEALLIGAEVVGSDIDGKMVAGCKRNLSFLGLPDEDIELRKMDVSEVVNHIDVVDAIATDPPYGRSASTNKENIDDLYARSFEAFSHVLKSKGKLCIVLPDKKFTVLSEEYFSLENIYDVYVHRSLTRYFCVFTA